MMMMTMIMLLLLVTNMGAERLLSPVNLLIWIILGLVVVVMVKVILEGRWMIFAAAIIQAWIIIGDEKQRSRKGMKSRPIIITLTMRTIRRLVPNNNRIKLRIETLPSCRPCLNRHRKLKSRHHPFHLSSKRGLSVP